MPSVHHGNGLLWYVIQLYVYYVYYVYYTLHYSLQIRVSITLSRSGIRSETVTSVISQCVR